jgi:hypothetical protein
VRFPWRQHPLNGDRIVIERRFTLRAAGSNVVREATGTEDNKTDSWGDPSSNAKAMALGLPTSSAPSLQLN